MAKKTKNPYDYTFGSPEYLRCKYDDIDTVVESTRSKFAREIKALVKSLSTDKDNMHVYHTYKTTGVDWDGESKRETYIVHVAMGLNGPGKGSDYLAAIKRLLDSGKLEVVFDMWIDACDDLWDVLLSVRI